MTVATKRVSTNGVQEPERILIAPIAPKILEVEIEGISPLLVHAWSQKAITQISDKQTGKARGKKAPKVPLDEYNASRYISTEGWDGVPAGGIKGCLVNACRAVEGLPMTLAKRMIFIKGQGQDAKGKSLVRIIGEPKMDEAMVRIDNGNTVDLRYRAIYMPWSMKLEIEFLSNIISAEMLVNLLNMAGFVEGLCEWRPGSPKNCTGELGRFKVRSSE